MVCPNCKSKEIVAIQGQHYCLNCGQLVPETAVVSSAPPVAPDLAIKIADTPLKIVGSAPAVPKKPESPTAVASTTKVKVASRQRLDSSKDSSAPTSTPKAGANTQPTIKPLKADIQKIAPQTTPVAPKQTTPEPFVAKVVSVPAAAKSKPPALIIDSASAAKPTKQHTQHNFHLILITLSALIVVSGFALAVTIGQDPLWQIISWLYNGVPSNSLSSSLYSGIAIVGGLVFFTYLLLVLAQASIGFNLVRKAAGRQVKDDVARRTAQASLPSIFGVDARIMFWLAALAVIEVGLVKYITAVTVNLPAAEPYLLAITSLLVLYYASALWAVRNLALLSTTVSGSSSADSVHRGWQLYDRHTADIIVGQLLVLVYSLLFALPAFASWLYLKLTPGASQLRLPLTGAWLILSALAVYLILNHSINFWSRIYVESVSLLPNEESTGMLGGRKINTSHRRTAALAGTALIALAVIAMGAWQTGWAAHLPSYFSDWIIR